MSLSQFFSFDPEDRLKDWSTPGGILPSNRSWDLSLEGNWKTSQKDGIIENRTHNGVHEISDIDGVQIYHDDKGNLIQDKSGQQYNWDFDNQMSSANVNGVIFSYAYDALGRRVYKEGNGNTTVFVNNSRNQVVSEYENLVDTNSERVFVYATYVDDPILIEEDSSIYYYHSNRQFSVSALTDDNGQIFERYAYDSYGEPLLLTDSPLVDQPYTLTGRRLDSETGLMYFRARYYSAELGRFIGRDPLGYVDGMSMYRGYFAVNGVDPSGTVIKYQGSSERLTNLMKLQVDNYRRSSDKAEEIVKKLEDSKNIHVVTDSTTDCNNTPRGPKDEHGGRGSTTRYDPVRSTKVEHPTEKGKDLDLSPTSVLAHELQHSHQRDTNTTDKTNVPDGYDVNRGRPRYSPQNEKEAVEAADRYRESVGETKREHYTAGK